MAWREVEHRGCRPARERPDLKRQRHLLADADVILVMTEQQRGCCATSRRRRQARAHTCASWRARSGDIADPSMQDRGRLPPLPRRDHALPGARLERLLAR